MKFSASSDKILGANHIQSKVIAPTIKRLKGLIGRHYGCQLDFIELSDEANLKPLVLKDLAVGKRPFRLDNKVYFPISIKGSLAALAQVTEPQPLSKTDLDGLADLFSLFIESALITAERLDLLNEIEDRLLKIEASSDKVVDLSAYREKRKIPFGPAFDFLKPRNSRLNDHYAVSCLIESSIESSRPLDILKLALDLHERSGRYAFLHLSDLQLDYDELESSIAELGAVTLFIPDLEKMRIDTQLLLARRFNFSKISNKAHIIAGINRPRTELVADKKLSPELSQILSRSHLKISSPYNPYRSQEITNFFLNEHSPSPLN